MKENGSHAALAYLLIVLIFRLHSLFAAVLLQCCCKYASARPLQGSLLASGDTTTQQILLFCQGTALYLDVIRECYEAYVIYNFFMYLVAYLEDEYGDVDAYFSTKEDVQHLWGLSYIVRPWRMGEEFFWECKKVRAYRYGGCCWNQFHHHGKCTALSGPVHCAALRKGKESTRGAHVPM